MELWAVKWVFWESLRFLLHLLFTSVLCILVLHVLKRFYLFLKWSSQPLHPPPRGSSTPVATVAFACFVRARATPWSCQQPPSLQTHRCSGWAKRDFVWAPVNETTLWCAELDRRVERADVHISHLCYQNRSLPMAAAWAPAVTVEIPVGRPLPLLAALAWSTVCLFVYVVAICGQWSFPGGLLRQDLQGTTQTAPRSQRNQEP